MIGNFLIVELSKLELAEKWCTIIIAASTLSFSFYIYWYQLKKDEKNLKLDWYKLIIIESKFDEFFTFFENIDSSLSRLKTNKSSSAGDKSKINAEILEHLSNLRLEFVSLLLAVDKMLYDCVLHQFDKLVDGITNSLADENINLNDEIVFEEEITKRISRYKTLILKMFVEFKGENDTHKNTFKTS